MSCPTYNISTSFTATLTTICCISGFLAAVENTVVLLSVRKIRSLRTTARYFMNSLAAAELFTGVTGNYFLSSWLILNHSRHGTIKVLWKTESAIWFFTTAATTFNLVNVALDRYIAVTSPLHYYTRMNSARCIMLITFAWFAAFSGALVVYFVPGKNLPELWICGTVVAVIIPFCIIAYCYFHIYKATKRTFPARENITDAQQVAENKRQRKTACTFGIITSLFIVLYTPSFILNCIQLFNTSFYRDKEKMELCLDSTREVWACIAAASYFSAIFDPWIYVIRMPDFRIAFKGLLKSLSRIFIHCKSAENQCQARAKREPHKVEDCQGTEAVSKEEIFDTAL